MCTLLRKFRATDRAVVPSPLSAQHVHAESSAASSAGRAAITSSICLCFERLALAQPIKRQSASISAGPTSTCTIIAQRSRGRWRLRASAVDAGGVLLAGARLINSRLLLNGALPWTTYRGLITTTIGIRTDEIESPRIPSSEALVGFLCTALPRYSSDDTGNWFLTGYRRQSATAGGVLWRSSRDFTSMTMPRAFSSRETIKGHPDFM